MKSLLKPVAKSFKATLERMQSNLGWVIIRIPFDVPKTWGTRGMLRVKGKINGFAFRTSLFPTGRGFHYLLVNKHMQARSSARAGDTAHFYLEPDLAERQAILPVELKRYLKEDRSLLRWYNTLSYSIRKWLTDGITQVKSAEARERRAEQVAEQLLSAMEAERELPPVLKAAFGRDPRALKGWLLMTPLHRRTLLLAIFYYRNPESRDRRVAKVLEEAVALSAKKATD